MKNYAYTFELNELAKIEVFYWDDNFDLQRDELKEKECSWDWMPGGFRLSWLSMAVSEWVSTLVENKISSWLRLTCSNRIVCHIKYIYPNAYQSSVGTCDYGHRIFQRNEYWHPNEKQIIWENAKICVECVALEIGGKLFRPATKMYRSSGLALRVLNLMKEIEAEIRDMCCVGHEFHCCCHNIPGE